MQKIIDFQINKEHYHADACIVWCFDDRFTPVLKEFVKNKEFEHFDIICIAGGAKTLSSPESESERTFILKQIEISLKLHHTPKLVLMNHSDCGAYGGLEDKEVYIKELGIAKDFLQKNLSREIPIDLLFVDCSGIWEIS